VESTWTPHGVEVDFGLGQIEEVSRWSLGGLPVESIKTPGMLNKMHP